MTVTFSLASRIIVVVIVMIACAVIAAAAVIVLVASPLLWAAWTARAWSRPPRRARLSRADKRTLRATEAQLATISSEDAEATR